MWKCLTASSIGTGRCVLVHEYWEGCGVRTNGFAENFWFTHFLEVSSWLQMLHFLYKGWLASSVNTSLNKMIAQCFWQSVCDWIVSLRDLPKLWSSCAKKRPLASIYSHYSLTGSSGIPLITTILQQCMLPSLDHVFGLWLHGGIRVSRAPSLLPGISCALLTQDT